MKRTTIEPTAKKKLVLVGNGPAGFKFCEKFVKYRLGRQYDLVVYGEEQHPAYDRINLTRLFTAKAPSQLYLAPAAWYANNKITLKTGQQVSAINRTEKQIQLANGATEQYDTLILATGSAPFVPPIAGCDQPGVFVYRTVDDLAAIQAYIEAGQHAVVIGGGILGLEAARALVQEGLVTTVVETAPHLMPRQLDKTGAGILQQQLEQLGLRVHCGKQAQTVTTAGITCTDGSTLVANVVVISAGIRARDELARDCGLPVGATGGIIVNNFNLTADEHIFAIGECALSDGKIWGLAAPCYEMAEVVAARLAKIYKVFSGHLPLTKLKVMDVQVASFGDAIGIQPHTAHIFSTGSVYKRVNISPDGKYVLGGMLVGEAGDAARLFHLQRNHVKITGEPAELVAPQASTGAEKITSLPNDTLICLCEGVCKGDIVAAIRENNCTRLDEVKKDTGAGTGCESCTSLLEDLLAELRPQPIQTNDA